VKFRRNGMVRDIRESGWFVINEKQGTIKT